MSGMGYVGKATNLSKDVVGTQAQAEREDVWGEMPAEVVSFNTDNQTIVARPKYKPRRLIDGVLTPIDMPDLLDLPVRFQRIGNFVITIPVKPGDTVTIRPQMRNSEKWHTEGVYEANDTRSMHLADYEAFIDGGESLTKPISNFNNTNLEIRTEDGAHKIEFSEDGKFKINGGEGNVYSMIAEALELLAEHKTIVTVGSSAGTYAHDKAGAVADIAAKLRAMEIA